MIKQVRKPRELPTLVTAIFSALALVCAMIAALLSLFPFFGIFSFLPLIAGSVFTVIALVLCHLENSRRVLPLIAVVLLLLTSIGLIFQLTGWGAAFRELTNGA